VAAVGELSDQHPGATWLTGGAVGTDQIATRALLERGERVELVLPFPDAIQAARWTGRQHDTLRDHIARVAAVHVVHPRYTATGYRDRNQHMVDHADLLLACWNGRPGSGTAMTVRMAQHRRIPVVWVGMY
jgi:uncharacterized phage-like protein YoqJ